MLSQLQFHWPWLLLLWPLPGLLRLLLPSLPRPQPALQVPDLSRFSTAQPRPAAASVRSSKLRLGLLWLIWTLLLLAAARPYWLGPTTQLPDSGRDLLLAVDLSGSMNIDDMYLGSRQVTRLDAVKAVLQDFVARRQGDRVGLILFGTQAYVHVPLTLDLATVLYLLEEASVGIAGPRTAIGDAIGLGVRYLESRPGDGKVIILLTDGANNAGQLEPLQAAEIAARQQVRVHTIGVGGGGALPGRLLTAPGRMLDPGTEVDALSLQQIAQRTGGQHFMASNTAELEGIYLLLDQLEPISLDGRSVRPTRALGHWPLGAALGLWSLLLLPLGRDHG